MDIGSGKPSAEDQKKIAHHGINLADPDEDFTVGDFIRYAEMACRKIRERNRIPAFVGGTGFYVDSFFCGLSEIPDIEVEIRAAVRQEFLEKGSEVMHAKLKEVDPRFAAGIHPKDKSRIIRGLEVWQATGIPISRYYVGRKGRSSEDTVYIGIFAERDLLAKRINDRVDSMIEAGFIGEVENLRAMGYGPELKSMKSIGYLELNMYLDGITDKSSAVDAVKTETRRYAKRQMTWFRRNKKINWFRSGENDAVLRFIENRFLKNKDN